MAFAQAPAAAPAALPSSAPQTASPAPRSLPSGATPNQTTSNGTSNANTQNTSSTTNSTNRQSSSENRDTERTSAQVIVPDAPTEFQRLVAETTGSPLPIFGASLFSGVPSTFAPVEDIPVAPGYVLGPGDEIRVQLYGQVNQQESFTIDRTGDISYPDVGTIHLAGLPYGQLQSFLRSQLGRVYRNFDLNVNMGQLRSMQVFVVGQARRPGSYTISSLSTLLNALFASGGPLPTGSLRDIQVTRQGVTLVHFDLYDLLLHGDKSKDIPLAPGDTIFIPVVGQQVAIAGSVNVPAIYEIKPGDKVSQALALAGGESSVALGAQVRLDRIFEHTMRSIVDVNLAKGQDPTLQNGDILTIAAILDRYKDAVTLRGNVAFPGRYVWRPGVRITDLVPSKDQLITREYYRRRNALGNFASGFSPGGEGSLQITQSGAAQDRAVQAGTGTGGSNSGNSLGSALTTTNTIFSPSTDVVLSAPDIDWSYAVIERLSPETLKTSLIEFNPGKLYLEGDQSQNLPLQSGDVLTFFSTADIRVPTSQQTRFVRLEGEFTAPGVYSVEPGETLQHLLSRVGGFTQEAYLYGSEFTRQSTRRIEQQRLNEYADQLEAQVSAASAGNAARAISDRDAAAANAASVQARENIARIRRLVPLGRIVLELKPNSRGVDSVPDMALEDGDRFVVPRVPSTVSVEGQVYSANAFLYAPTRRERDYLRQAGGPDRDADKKRVFIIRADGSVFSHQYGDVDRANIFPGDTIVVPPRIERTPLLPRLLDISSIVGQFGLGAAAVEVLK